MAGKDSPVLTGPVSEGGVKSYIWFVFEREQGSDWVSGTSLAFPCSSLAWKLSPDEIVHIKPPVGQFPVGLCQGLT